MKSETTEQLKRQFFAIILAAMIVAALVLIIVNVQTHYKEQARVEKQVLLEQIQMQILEQTPPKNWMDILEVTVFDSYQSNPIYIRYSRNIFKDFFAFWEVNVLKRNTEGEEVSVCYGGQRSPYYASDKTNEKLVTLEWYIGKVCNLPMGKYTIVTTWKIELPSKIRKTIKFSSNKFLVK